MRGIVIADTHWSASKAMHPAYSLVKRFAADIKPDFVIHLGDVFEFDYLARFNEANLKALSEGSFDGDYELGNRELDDWQAITDEVILLEGNHDERVERLCERAPALEGLVDVPKRLYLRERGVAWHRQVKQPLEKFGWHWLHGVFSNKYHAEKHLSTFMTSVAYGHVHAVQEASMRRPFDGELIRAKSIPCLCELQPMWRKGNPTKHSHGFGVIELAGTQHSLYVLSVHNGAIVYGGEVWSLNEAERALAHKGLRVT